MSGAVDVDLGSAVVVYRPAAGEERSVSAEEVSPDALLHAAPWRTFRWYFGQRHYSGTYWCANAANHVIYESRLELANLLLAHFDPAVHRGHRNRYLARVWARRRSSPAEPTRSSGSVSAGSPNAAARNGRSSARSTAVTPRCLILKPAAMGAS